MALNVGTITATLKLRDEMNSALRTAEGSLKKFGGTGAIIFAKLGAAAVAGLGTVSAASLKAASDFETSFAGVRKTVDATEKEFAALEQAFRGLSREIPINVNEINRIGEAAGQLGIETQNIVGFTKTMAELGVTTNMSANDAATSLARLANITQMPQTEFSRLGSTIVDLGNKFATTESEITGMGLRIAGAGQQIGLAEHEILGFGAALSSVGISAEAGGTAISRVFSDISAAAMSGGESLDMLAKVAGQSAAEFKQSFETDAAGAITSFVEGLGKLSKSGGDTFGVLDSLGFGSIRVRDALLRTSNAGDLLRRSLETGSAAWQANVALTNEAAQRYATLASKVSVAWNIIKDLGITVGQMLIPVVSSMVGWLQDWSSNTDNVAGATRFMASVFIGTLKAVDLAQTTFRAFQVVGANVVLMLKRSAKAIVDVGVAAVGLVRSIPVLGDQFEIVADAGAYLQGESVRLGNDIKGLVDRSDAATASSIKFGNELVRLQWEIENISKRSIDAAGDIGLLGDSAGGATPPIADLDAVAKPAADTLDAVGAGAKKAAEQTESFAEMVSRVQAAQAAANSTYQDAAKLIMDVADSSWDAGLNLGSTTDIVDRMNRSLVTLPSLAKNINLEFGQTTSVFDGVKESFAGLMKGLTGGKGLKGLFSNLGKGMMDGFGQILSGGISGLISSGVGAVKGLFSKLMGGPDEAELEGRKMVEAFEATVVSGLNRAQLAEGTEHWEKVVIGVRDAFLATGRSVEEGEAAVQQMWSAIKQGPDAVGPVIDSIQNVLEASDLVADALKGMGSGQLPMAEQWAAVVDHVSEAYLKTGRSAEEAEAMTHELWTAVEQGPAAVQEVLAQVALVTSEFEKITAEELRAIEGLQGLVDKATEGGEILPAQIEPFLASLTQIGTIAESDMAAIMALAGQTTVDFQAMEAAANKYGVELSALGPSFDSARLTAAAQTISADFAMLATSGADVGAVLNSMSDETQELINDAQAAGVAIPASMQPMIEQMMAAGLLVDENGQKMTEMGALNFAEPIIDKTAQLIESIQGLIEKLSGGVGAIGDLASAAANVPDIDIKVNFDVGDVPDFPGSGEMNIGIPSFDTGGFVHEDQVAMVHKGERVQTPGQQQMDGGDMAASELQGLRQDMQTLPLMIRDAIMGAA